MEKSEFDIYVSPMEHRKSFGEKSHYTFRTPLAILKNPTSEFFQDLKTTAGVAFHGKRGRIRYYIDEKNIPRIMQNPTNLSDIAAVEYQHTDEKELVPSSSIKTVNCDCVDRREDDKGADPNEGTAQITHPGGLIMLDPDLRMNVPDFVQKYLERQVLQTLAESNIKITRLSAHFGEGDVPGCGGIKFLKNTSARANELYKTPTDIRDALDRVRNRLSMIMASNCGLIGDVIFKDGGTIAFKMDDPSDFKAMNESGKLNI